MLWYCVTGDPHRSVLAWRSGLASDFGQSRDRTAFMTRFKVPVFLKSFLPEHRPMLPLSVFGLAAAFFAVTLLFSLHRYFTFYASYDQGIFNQMFWNGIHGDLFQSSLSSVLSGAVVHDNQIPTVDYHRLGQHFDPVMLLWHPFYALFPSPATLVVLQLSLLTAAGLVVYALARCYLQPAIATMITAAYYGSVTIIGPSFSNFNDLCQIPLYVFTLLLAMEKRWWWLFWLMAGLTLLIRQDTGVVLFGVGSYLALSRRHPKAGIALCIASFGYILLATNVFMPMFSKDISQRFMIERFGQFADSDEASTLQILWGIISNPSRLLGHLFGSLPRVILYLLAQTLSLIFVPLASGVAWAIAGFPLLQLWLQQGQSALSIEIRYAVTLVPGLFYGAILWWSQHGDRFKSGVKRLWIGGIVLAITIACLKSPHKVFYFALPDSYQPWVHVSLTRQWEHAGHIRSLIQQVPPEAPITATTYIVPHVSSRREVLRMPFLQVLNDDKQVIDAEYILADLWQLQQYQVAFKAERQQIKAFVPLIDQLITQNRYGIQGLEDGVILLRKGISSPPELLQSWNELRQSYQPLLSSTPSNA